MVYLDCGLVLLLGFLVYCDVGKHPDLAKTACSHCTLYGHNVRALDVYSVTGLACTANSRWPTVIIHTVLYTHGQPRHPVTAISLELSIALSPIEFESTAL